MCIFCRLRMLFQLKRLTKKIRVNDLCRSVDLQKYLYCYPRSVFYLGHIGDFEND